MREEEEIAGFAPEFQISGNNSNCTVGGGDEKPVFRPVSAFASERDLLGRSCVFREGAINAFFCVGQGKGHASLMTRSNYISNATLLIFGVELEMSMYYKS